MKRRLIVGVKLATLLGTSWLLIATSQQPPTCTPEGPLRFDVTGTCGPAVEVLLSKNAACEPGLAGAEVANLPSGGSSIWVDRSLSAGDFHLVSYESNFVVPGTAQPDEATGEEDGGVVADAGASGDGGTRHSPGSVFNSCTVLIAEADGRLPFECYDVVSAEVVCTGTLTPKP